MSETVKNVCHNFHGIPKASVNSLSPIKFIVVIDATVVVKYWKFIESRGASVRGVKPKILFDIKEYSCGGDIPQMKEFVEVKYRVKGRRFENGCCGFP